MVGNTGNQSIDGVKTHTSIIRIKNNTIEQMTNPEAYNERGIFASDKNDIRIGSIGFAMMTDGSSRTYIEASKNINGTQTYNIFENYLSKTGEASTYLQGKLLKTWIIETWRSGTSWYRKWSDGWIEQGGQTPRAADTICTVTFPIAFTQDNPNVQMTRRFYYANDGTASQNRTTGIWGVSRTGFSTYDNGWSGAGGSAGVYYACGY